MECPSHVCKLIEPAACRCSLNLDVESTVVEPLFEQLFWFRLADSARNMSQQQQGDSDTELCLHLVVKDVFGLGQ